MSEQVTMWKTKDGKIYDSEDEADLNETKEELISYIDRYPIHGLSDDCTIYGDSFQEWVKENPRIYIQLLPENANEERS